MFYWCHIIHLHSMNKYAQQNKRADKEIAASLNYEVTECLVAKKGHHKIDTNNDIRISVFVYVKNKVYPIYSSKQNFENYMELLLVNNKGKSHYIYIKDFHRFIYNKTNHGDQIRFCMNCLQRFNNREILANHREG